MSFQEEIEDFRLDRESGEWPAPCRDSEEENLSGESEKWDEGSVEIDGGKDSLYMILADEKRCYHDWKLQTDPSSWTYNLEHHDVNRGQELEMTVVSRKSFREISCSSNIRTNLESEIDRAVL